MPNDAARYRRYRFPPATISHAVWLYYRFTLSFRDVEDLLAYRGITVSYESIRHWWGTFGLAYVRRLRHRAGPVGDTWHLDELFLTIRGRRHYLWRAVDEDGEVIDILLQPRRDRHAAARFFRKLLKRSRRVQRRLVTDGLGSYRAAHRVIMPSVAHDTTSTPTTRPKSHTSRRAGASATCGASSRWHRPSDSSRSMTSCTTCSPWDDIGFAPAINGFCDRGRSPRGTPR
jgi:putative transposase